jgi:hypothetical protein
LVIKTGTIRIGSEADYKTQGYPSPYRMAITNSGAPLPVFKTIV